jgi:hypothetical protein
MYCWNERKVLHGKDLKGEIKDATPYSPKAVAFKLRSQETQVSVGVFQDSASTFRLHENF